MKWSMVLKKFAKHAAVTGGAVMVPMVLAALAQAGCISGVDWLGLLDRSGAAALSAVIGGVIGGGMNAVKHSRKGTATTVTAVVACLFFLAGPALCAPFLVCDPAPVAEGVTHYEVILGTGAPVMVPAPLKYDLAAVPAGANTVQVRAVKIDPLWGTLKSTATPFSFTRPAAPGATVAVRLEPN